MAYMPKMRPSLPRSDVIENHRYVVTVETGHAKHSGTNEEVKLQLFGDRGVSEPILLRASESVETTLRYATPTAPSEREAFSPGSIIEFSFQAPFVGNLVKIRVSHGDNVKTRGTSWKLERIVVRDDSLMRSWSFNSLTWFIAENDQECEFVPSGDIAAGRRASTRQARRRSMGPNDDNLTVFERMKSKFDVQNVDPVSANAAEGGVRRVCFKLHWNQNQQYDLKESYMYLFGAIPALGNWDTSKAVRMNLQTGGDGTWRGEWRLEMEIDDDYDLIEYQYFAIDEKHDTTLFRDKSHFLKLSEAADTDDRTVEGGVIYVRDSFAPNNELDSLKELTPNSKNLRTPVKITSVSANGFVGGKNKSVFSPRRKRNSLGFISRGGSEFLQSPADAGIFISPEGTPVYQSPEMDPFQSNCSTSQLQKELESTSELLKNTTSELAHKNEEIKKLKKNLERRGSSALDSILSPSDKTDSPSPVTSDSLSDELDGELAIGALPDLGGSVEDAKSESPEVTDNEDSLVSSINLGLTPLRNLDDDDADVTLTSNRTLDPSPRSSHRDGSLFTPPQYPQSLIGPLRRDALKTREEALELRRMFDELQEEMKREISAFEARQAEFVRLVMDWKERQNAEKDVLMAKNVKTSAALEETEKRNEEAKAARAIALKRIEELEASWKKEFNERRRLFNEVQELRGNIRVFCRVRPPKQKNMEGPAPRAVSIPNRNLGDFSLVEAGNRKFHITHAFGPGTSQEAVYDETSGVIGSVLDGYNVCVFAYGQTGSGKTHTMSGPKSDPGVNYRALGDLFRIGAERAEFCSMDVTVSMLEIYNETLKDLLYVVNKREPPPKLDIRQDPKQKSKTAVYIPNLTEIPVTSVGEVWKVMNRGSKNRVMHATSMNEHSSRSHLILRVRVDMVNSRTGVKSQGLLSMVDLAGSERVGRSNATGDRLREAQSINKSLANLGDVFNALYEKSAHVPYRNSKLTHFLGDSLGGDSKTLMFVNVSCDEEDTNETVSSLLFAQRVAKIELGSASKHAENSVDVKRVMASANEKESQNQNLQSTNASLLRELKKKDHLLSDLRLKIRSLETDLKNASRSATNKAKKEGNERTDFVREIRALKRTEEKAQAEVRQLKLKVSDTNRKREEDERRFKIVMEDKDRKFAILETKLAKAKTLRTAASPTGETVRAGPARARQSSPIREMDRRRQQSPTRERPPVGSEITNSPTSGSSSVPNLRLKSRTTAPRTRLPRVATVASTSRTRVRNEEDTPTEESTTPDTLAPRRMVESKSEGRRLALESRRATSKFEPRRVPLSESRRASTATIPRAATIAGRSGKGPTSNVSATPRRGPTAVPRGETRATTTATPARSATSGAATQNEEPRRPTRPPRANTFTAPRAPRAEARGPTAVPRARSPTSGRVTSNEETQRPTRPIRANTLSRPPQRNNAGRLRSGGVNGVGGPRRATTFTSGNRTRARREKRENRDEADEEVSLSRPASGSMDESMALPTQAVDA